MIVISEENIQSTNEFFEALDDQGAAELGERFAKEQPYLLTYVQAMAEVANEEDDPDESLAEELTYYAIFIWKAFTWQTGAIPMISEKEVEKLSEGSLEELQKSSQSFESGDLENSAGYFKNLPQPFLFNYFVEELFGDVNDPEFDEEFSDTSSNYLFLICNQVIHMLDKKVNGNNLKVVR